MSMIVTPHGFDHQRLTPELARVLGDGGGLLADAALTNCAFIEPAHFLGDLAKTVGTIFRVEFLEAKQADVDGFCGLLYETLDEQCATSTPTEFGYSVLSDASKRMLESFDQEMANRKLDRANEALLLWVLLQRLDHSVRRILVAIAGSEEAWFHFTDSVERRIIDNATTGLTDGWVIVRTEHPTTGDAAAEEVIRHWISKLRDGLSRTARLSAVLLFIGPARTGKTRLAKELARAVYGSEDAFSRFEMAEFCSSEHVGRFVATLAKRLLEKPNSVILFDEIEKAHPNVLTRLTEFLGSEGSAQAIDGVETDSHWIAVLTSNLNATQLGTESSPSLDQAEEKGAKPSSSARQASLLAQVPGLRDLIDDIVTFNGPDGNLYVSSTDFEIAVVKGMPLKLVKPSPISLDTREVFPAIPEVSPEDFAKAFESAMGSDRALHLGPRGLFAERDDQGLERYFDGTFGASFAEVFPLSMGTVEFDDRSIEIPSRLGTYEILELLGKGAFTVVCLARDASSYIGREVALKIPTRQSGDKEWDHRLLTEAKVWRRLSEGGHPSILALEDLKRIGNIAFFVTEYMDGRDLASALEGIPLELRLLRVIHALQEICEGLAYAHDRGVVHGDIKPQNILVSADLKRVKLGDFGLSFMMVKADTECGGPSRFVGTLPFLAPECFDGEKTPQTDIYALGVTLFYVLTGGWPFRCESVDMDKLRAERLAFRPNLREMQPQIPSWLAEVVSRCLSPRSEDRFSSGSELLEHVLPYVDPARGSRVILTALANPESQTVDYDVEVKGQRSREMLTVETTFETVRALCAQWDRLGELAIERVWRRGEGGDSAQVDGDIRALLTAIAADGAHFMLGRRVRAILQRECAATLWLLHDPRLTAIPWELLDVDGKCLCERFPMARSPRLHRGSSTGSKLEETDKIRVLLVADPCGDLPGAREECERLKEMLKTCPTAERIDVDVADSSTDSFTLRSKMRRCDILHFAGHAVFAERHGNLASSGWLLRGDIATPQSGDLLKASALDDLWTENAPVLVFGNSCVSGRSSLESLRQKVTSDAAMGLAQAFLSAGVTNYIGTVWEPPDDDTTAEFAIAFYQEFFGGRSVAQSLQAAREKCLEMFGREDLTWARYVLFGDPFTYIPLL